MGEVGERDRNVAGQFPVRVRAVPEDMGDAPAPCEGWVVRDVVRHSERRGAFTGRHPERDVHTTVADGGVASVDDAP